jgi:hypothetical protein
MQSQLRGGNIPKQTNIVSNTVKFIISATYTSIWRWSKFCINFHLHARNRNIGYNTPNRLSLQCCHLFIEKQFWSNFYIFRPTCTKFGMKILWYNTIITTRLKHPSKPISNVAKSAKFLVSALERTPLNEWKVFFFITEIILHLSLFWNALYASQLVLYMSFSIPRKLYSSYYRVCAGPLEFFLSIINYFFCEHTGKSKYIKRCIKLKMNLSVTWQHLLLVFWGMFVPSSCHCIISMLIQNLVHLGRKM